MQTSGKACRENAAAYLLFEIRIAISPRHCEERRDEAIQLCGAKEEVGLLRFARNDVDKLG